MFGGVRAVGFNLSFFKTKSKPNPLNQSELEANTLSRRHARENACGQVTIALGFISD